MTLYNVIVKEFGEDHEIHSFTNFAQAKEYMEKEVNSIADEYNVPKKDEYFIMNENRARIDYRTYIAWEIVPSELEEETQDVYHVLKETYGEGYEVFSFPSHTKALIFMTLNMDKEMKRLNIGVSVFDKIQVTDFYGYMESHNGTITEYSIIPCEIQREA